MTAILCPPILTSFGKAAYFDEFFEVPKGRTILDIPSKAAWYDFCLAGRLSQDKDQFAALPPQLIASLTLERDSLLAKEA
jgi:hypothetical protein